MNARVRWIKILNVALMGAVWWFQGMAWAQSGGINQPGPGQIGDAFKMWTLRCTIKANAPGSPSPDQAGARWRTKGSQNWYQSGDKVVLPPATYTIEFKGKVEGWIAPSDKTVVLDRDKTESGTYRRREPEPPKPPKDPAKPGK